VIHESTKRKMRKTEKQKVQKASSEIAGAGCNDAKCHIHGSLKARGKVFEGTVTKKFPKRVVIEFERMIYVSKYERYKKSKTKVHARLPDCISGNVNVGDYIKVRECRPLSKIIHFVVFDKVRSKEEKK